MLRLLSIRNFVVVAALDVEFDAGFTVLTGETGAGKSILLDALGLLLGDRFELRQLRPQADRAELAAEFAIDDALGVRAWLAEHDFGSDEQVLVRRVLDAQGRSRAWINGRVATLAQLTELGEQLVDLHGQNAHQSLAHAAAQRELVDAFGGFASLTRSVGEAWRAWRDAAARRDAALSSAQAGNAERELLAARRDELDALGLQADEWDQLSATQSRLAHAASLIEATTLAEQALSEDDDALVKRLAQLTQRLSAASQHDPSLAEVIDLLQPAAIQLDEAVHALRNYRRRLDLDPGELQRVEERLATLHDTARKYRVRADGLHALLAETQARLTALSDASDVEALSRRAEQAQRNYGVLAEELSRKREMSAEELANRVTTAMQELAMAGGRFEVGLVPLAEPASYGRESVEFRVASHPRQPLGPLARVASGGELSRIALAVQVVSSEVGAIPTLVFDEVDTGIGGAVAATVGRLLQALGERRQVLCVTHLPQVAAHADQHYRVTKTGNGEDVSSDLAALKANQRVDELARMLSGPEITAKTRAHAKELYQQSQRSGQKPRDG